MLMITMANKTNIQLIKSQCKFYCHLEKFYWLINMHIPPLLHEHIKGLLIIEILFMESPDELIGQISGVFCFPSWLAK